MLELDYIPIHFKFIRTANLRKNYSAYSGGLKNQRCSYTSQAEAQKRWGEEGMQAKITNYLLDADGS